MLTLDDILGIFATTRFSLAIYRRKYTSRQLRRIFKFTNIHDFTYSIGCSLPIERCNINDFGVRKAQHETQRNGWLV